MYTSTVTGYMPQESKITLIVPREQAGNRLDKVLAKLFPEYSRSRLQDWLKQGHIRMDGAPCQAKQKVQGDELLQIDVPEPEFTDEVRPERITINVIHEDPALIVVAKPPGMVVHPAAGNREGTLQNALLHRYPELAGLPRGGLVHRLDKDTSGLLVVARNLRAHKSLVDQLQARTVAREYDAVVQGTLVAGGVVDAPIGRHPVDRKRMAVRRNEAEGRGSKRAVTHYRVAEKFRRHTHLHVKLETGRTHQIRVHMAHLKKPLVGDPVYGGRMKVPGDCTPALRECLQHFKRQALHAGRLGLDHPESGESLEWRVEMPEDLRALLTALREDTVKHDD